MVRLDIIEKVVNYIMELKIGDLQYYSNIINDRKELINQYEKIYYTFNRSIEWGIIKIDNCSVEIDKHQFKIILDIIRNQIFHYNKALLNAGFIIDDNKILNKEVI